MDREQRRERTRKVCEQRKKRHHDYWARRDSIVPRCRWCIGSAHRYAKYNGGCNCRHRRRGNPKIGGGVCCMGYREAVRARQEWRHQSRYWVDWVISNDPLDCQI